MNFQTCDVVAEPSEIVTKTFLHMGHQTITTFYVVVGVKLNKHKDNFSQGRENTLFLTYAK
jgi:hypothetical protein